MARTYPPDGNWRWRCEYVRGVDTARCVQNANALLRRLAEAGALPLLPDGQPIPVAVNLNPSGVSATITYYGGKLPAN